MKKIYILGEVKGAYRTQNFIKYLLDRPKEYSVCYSNFWNKTFIARYLKSILVNPLTLLKSNIVYVTTLNVDINILWELLLARIFCKKIIIDYYVSVHDTVVVDRGWFKENSFMAKVAMLIDKFFLKIGTRVIFLNQTEKKRYCENVRVDQNNKKFIIVPLCTEKICEVNSTFIKGEKSDINICWWGSYLPLHGLNRVIQAMKICKEEGLPIHCYFFGNDEKKSYEYVELAKKIGVDDICVFRNDYTFKNGKLSEFLKNQCDIALGNFGESEKSRNVLINKILDSCAMKTVLLTCYSNAVSEYFDGEKNVFMSEIEPCDIAEAINKIYNSEKTILKKRTDDAYGIYLKEFSVDIYLERIGSKILAGL